MQLPLCSSEQQTTEAMVSNDVAISYGEAERWETTQMP